MPQECHDQTTKARLALANRPCAAVKETASGTKIQVVVAGYNGWAEIEARSHDAQVIDSVDMYDLRTQVFENSKRFFVPVVLGASADLADLW